MKVMLRQEFQAGYRIISMTGTSILKRTRMIIRIWHGITLLSNADKYQMLLSEKVLPRYETAAGNLGVCLCREINDGLVNFLLLSCWSSRAALARFAGPAMDGVVLSPDERQLLLAFESVARNYEVFQMSIPDKGD